MSPERPKRILSGIQPSGKLHLGNYYGAMQQHIALQDHGDPVAFRNLKIRRLDDAP